MLCKVRELYKISKTFDILYAISYLIKNQEEIASAPKNKVVIYPTSTLT